MSRTEIEAIVAEHGMKIDHTREGAGKFRDLIIGTGKSYEALARLRDDLKSKGVTWVEIERVTNEDHEQFGQSYLKVNSFWYV